MKLAKYILTLAVAGLKAITSAHAGLGWTRFGPNNAAGLDTRIHCRERSGARIRGNGPDTFGPY
jgi:hypothetical protein